MKQNYFKKYVLVCVALVLSSIAAYAQTGTITGKVLDEKGETLPGVSVSITGTTQGATTSIDGVYRISNVKPGTYTLSAQFVGYTALKKTVTVTGGAAVTENFQLTPESKSLNEVVVIGYGTQTRKEVTGSISTVSSKDFQKGATTTPAELIQGKISGVSVTTNSGQPGAGATIRIRQGASLNSSNDPLIVVDGVPLSNSGISGVSNPLSLINPDDIETFTVLKDAASTAIYGSRASNGVILITTKKGTAGTPQISFSTKNSVSIKEGKLSVLSADQIRDYVKNYDATTGATRSAFLGKANTDWQNEIYQTALTTDNNLSIAGTTKKVPYRVSVGYLNQQGIVKTDHLERTTAAIRVSPKFFNDDLKVDLNVNGSYAHSRFANTDAIGAASVFDPTQPVRVDNSPWNGYFEWYNTPGDATSNLNPNAPRNPVGLLMDKNNTGDTYRSFGNAQFDYRLPFVKGLRANLNLGYDISKGGGSVFVPGNAAQAYTSIGSTNQYHQKNYNTTGEFYLNYNSDIKSLKSNINATAGYGVYDFVTSQHNYPTYSSTTGLVIASTIPTYAYDRPNYTLESYYARLIYTFNSKYIFAGSVRTDGSSKFDKDNRWGFFPSAAFTWRMSDEDFLKESKVLSDLKFRASFGVTGQQDGIGYYGYIPTYFQSASASQYQFGGTYYTMYAPSSFDKSLKWETTKSSNIGFDFGFLNQRITGTVDAYYKDTKDLLSTVFIAAGTNYTNQLTTNVGNMTNRGIELNLSGVAVKTKDINWTVNYNVAFNTNKITNLSINNDPTSVGTKTGNISGGTGTSVQIQSVGYSANSFYVKKQVYDEVTGKPLEGVYADLNGDGVVNDKDFYRYKSPFPKYIMGFSTNFSYKKWTASTVLRANLGNYIYNNMASNLGTRNILISSAGLINNASSDIFNTGFTSSQYLSDYYVQNASFLRMDNVGIGYSFTSLFRNSKMRLNVNANVQNVFVITKYKGIDPEVFGGIDNNFYQRPRTYTLSLNLGF